MVTEDMSFVPHIKMSVATAVVVAVAPQLILLCIDLKPECQWFCTFIQYYTNGSSTAD